MVVRNTLVHVFPAMLLLVAVSSWSTEDWRFAVRVNAWLPDVKGETAFFDRVEEQAFEIPVEDILEDLEFGFLGSFEASKGRWGFVTDLVYSSIGDEQDRLREGSIGGGIEIGTESRLSASMDVDTWIWNIAGFYRLLESATMTLDLLGGVRYADIEQELEWTISSSIAGRPLPERGGRAEVSADSQDLFLGIRGRIGLGDTGRLFIPFYLDAGTGDSDFTWQAAAGLGYAIGNWNLGLTWRHLEYDLDSGAPIGELELSGPAAVIEYTW